MQKPQVCYPAKAGCFELVYHYSPLFSFFIACFFVRAHVYLCLKRSSFFLLSIPPVFFINLTLIFEMGNLTPLTKL